MNYICSLPQKLDRPTCAISQDEMDRQNHQQQLDQHMDVYDLEDDILKCDNVDDDMNDDMNDQNNHSYVYLQQQQHYPPPLEFQEPPLISSPGSQQGQTLIKKGSIMRNNPELMKRNRQQNS